jgi:hypothetical protein
MEILILRIGARMAEATLEALPAPRRLHECSSESRQVFKRAIRIRGALATKAGTAENLECLYISHQLNRLHSYRACSQHCAADNFEYDLYMPIDGLADRDIHFVDPQRV